MNNDIPIAVELLRRCPELDDQQLYRALTAKGVGNPTAARLVVLIPIAYGRIILQRAGARLSPTFREKGSQGISNERALTSEPLWEPIITFAKNEVAQGASSQEIMLIAGRSAEFEAANQLLNSGSKLRDLAFGSPAITWPGNEE
jgi:hypothetical protein